MAVLDALIIHVPRFSEGRREIMVMAAGLPALANLLTDEGFSIEILHLGIESEVQRGFSLQRYLLTHRPRLVLLSLHWNQQTRPVLDVVEKVRRWLPEARIILGGLTASVFAEDLLSSLPSIDGVIRGDGEEPLKVLARAVLERRGNIHDVPNLVWRDSGGEVHQNSRWWVIDAETAGKMRHGNLERLRHHKAYLERALYADFSPGVEGSEGYPRATFLNAGRGCLSRCICCGGAASSQMITSGRESVVFYPKEKLLRDVGDAYAQGARTLRTSFDPPGSRRHIKAWLGQMRADGIELRVIYDLWGLPTAGLLDAIAACSKERSMVVYSPECGSEHVRRIVRPRSFSNAQLLRSVHDAEERGVDVHIFFSAGLPGERPNDVDQTARLIESIRQQTGASVSVAPMFIDPASALWCEPERFGVRLLRRTLQDFYDWTGRSDGPGYETEHFDEGEIVVAVQRLVDVSTTS